MFAAIYLFEVKQGLEDQFIDAWKALTNLIIKHEGGLGSRLHKQNENTYIAYAQWPDKQTWENSGKNLPEKANELRAIMKSSCTSIQTMHELHCVEDLLQKV